MYGSYHFGERKYPKELSEIAEKISSKNPPITWDDILDFFLALQKLEKRLKRNKKNITKKERKVSKPK
jgi:hypothetical protein